MTKHAFQCIIAIKAAKQNAANTFWKNNIDKEGGDKTFTRGLSATGAEPATWFCCSTLLEKWQLAKVVQVADNNPSDIRIIIWAYRKGVKQELLDKMDGRTYITIADSKQDFQSFLNATGMKVITE